MITFEEIAERLKDNKKTHRKGTDRYEEDWKPLRCDDYELPIFNVPTYSNAPGAKGKWAIKLSKILTFIDSVKHKRYKDGCTIMPISTRSETNLAIWGSQVSVSTNIKFMIEIGLLSYETTSRRFGNIAKTVCYTYRYYKDNEDKFIELCKANNIEAFIIKNNTYDEVVAINDISDFDKSKVLFRTHLRLVKPDNMTENQFEDFLTKCLYENYPQLKDYQELTDKINQDEYKDLPELRIKFRPKFSWSESGKMVTGIGIRATNSLATIKKEDRDEILKKYGFDRQKDVKSSVPRLTLSLNRGEWADEYTDYDLYEQIYRYCEPTGIYNEEKREAIKALYMRAYFDNSPDNIAYHTWNAMNQEGASEQDVKDKMKKLREAIETVSGGKTYGSYIFFVESCVYVWALHYLTVFGKHKLWLLYDCFYSSPTAWGYEDEITFRLIVNNCIKESFEEFISYNS